MENDFITIASAQLQKLPKSIQEIAVSEEVENKLAEISREQNLSQDQSTKLSTEVFLLLLCLTSPKSFSQTLKERLVLNEVTLAILIKALEERILEPVYPDLVRFYEQQEAARAKQAAEKSTQKETPATKTPTEKSPEVKIPPREKVPEVVPENLPTEENIPEGLRQEESFIPNLTPKIPVQGEQAPPTTQPEPQHPFEQKMQKVFSAGAPAMENLELPNEAQDTPKPGVTISRPATHDPYREPIE